MSSLIHFVYIHGFQGNDTTFQSFPTHLHQYVSTRLPPRLKIQSSIYPTYKSAKPISTATRNFLGWLATQPPAFVVLFGHSLGGLLAAEAATYKSNNGALDPKPYRIVGVVAFDTPYLGMHPHIVISGIVSLLPKGKDKKAGSEENKRSNKEMNDEKTVKVVDSKVTDGWESFKKNLEAPSHISFGSLSPPHSPSPSRSPSPIASPHGRSSQTPFLDHLIAFLSSRSNESFARWLRKHSDEPFTASIRWVVEHFQFGVCVFDPPGLKERYQNLVAWDGFWINYFTETLPRKVKGDESHKETSNADKEALTDYIALFGKDIPMSADMQSISSADPPSESESRPSEEGADEHGGRKDKPKKLHKHRGGKLIPARHFVARHVGCLGGGGKWEKVEIGGVEDEVAAHCGLFFPGQNLDYEGFVERVGTRVLGWCETL